MLAAFRTCGACTSPTHSLPLLPPAVVPAMPARRCTARAARVAPPRPRLSSTLTAPMFFSTLAADAEGNASRPQHRRHRSLSPIGSSHSRSRSKTEGDRLLARAHATAAPTRTRTPPWPLLCSSPSRDRCHRLATPTLQSTELSPSRAHTYPHRTFPSPLLFFSFPEQSFPLAPMAAAPVYAWVAHCSPPPKK